ncbi:MAG: hypothetical protein KKE02_20360 [Alphaproteobacteria bacterium]|nr:hypothetical protein [Alphaproteobacteria bacterium]MBU1514828.1 hypothetical protein [Alphaproteobacteria bacterium]MBU2093959.1 hypothetical protein [Alphaproteobacteria bacterium]MBU2153386.1 hypothetical protein [Alphaproteobacteria bacterium]MBU2309814.1 hypothetical protein [Alphaproteobacteria bacterium]
MRLFALVSGLAILGATPCLALTVSSAPPSRDAAQHLKPTENSGPRLQDTFAGSGRPASGASYSSGGTSVYSNTTSYGFGSVQTTITNDSRDPRFNDRRETAAPLGLVPRR